PGENESAGNIILGAVIPDFFGGDLSADVRVHGDEGGISGDEGCLGFRDEGGIAGEIDEIELDGIARAKSAGPFGVRQTRLDGDFTGNFFFVPVRGGGTFRNFAKALGRSGGKEQRRHQLRLAGAAVAYNANISDVLGRINFHDSPPRRCGQLRSPGDGPPTIQQARACAWRSCWFEGERGPTWVPVSGAKEKQ